MCTQPDRVQLALAAGLAVEPTVCRWKKQQCPDYTTCGYQRQKKYAGRIIFCAHEVLFGAKPPSFGDDLDAVVIDEDFVDAALGPMVGVDPKGGALENALETIAKKGDGWLARDIALEAGSNVDWYKATTEEWKRADPPEIDPGMTFEGMKAAIKAHDAQGGRSRLQVLRRARLYDDLELLTRIHGPATSGRIFVKEGKHGRAIHHKPLTPIAKGSAIGAANLGVRH
jgi:hypothetical protein